jgi:hypothetical protein
MRLSFSSYNGLSTMQQWSGIQIYRHAAWRYAFSEGIRSDESESIVRSEFAIE